MKKKLCAFIQCQNSRQNQVGRRIKSWFAYKNTKIGQGRENVKNFLNDNPSIAKEIENQILENAGIVEKAMMEGKVESKEKEKEEIKD